MSYRDRLKPGSFRGVPFKTPSSEHQGGIRGQVFEYPGSDQSAAQEMGLQVDRFTVTAIVIGPAYDYERNALIAALKKPGPGKLVHRFYGTFDAQLEPGQSYRVFEDQDKGGMATFTIPFIRAGKFSGPTMGLDSFARVKSAAGRSKLAVLQEMLDAFDTSGPESVRDSVMQTLRDVNNATTQVNGQISGLLAAPNQIAGQITTLGNSMATLVATPSRFGELADGLYAIQAAIFGALANVGKALFSVSVTRDGTGQAAAKAQTDARKLVKALLKARKDSALGVGVTANDAAVLGLVAKAATIEAVLAAAEMPYDSQENALATRDDLAAALEALAATSDYQTHADLTDLRVELTRHLRDRGGALPAITNYTPAITLPALLIAHRVHGDARRSEEIIARNNIRNPCFVPGGYPIKVVAGA